MKIIITERQKDLSVKNKQNNTLIDMIKYEGWDSTSKMVGGIENFKKLTGIETPIDFLNIFNDLEIVQAEEDEYWTYFRYEKENDILVYNRRRNMVYISYRTIWSFLFECFGFEYEKIQELTQEWLIETYGLREARTFAHAFG